MVIGSQANCKVKYKIGADVDQLLLRLGKWYVWISDSVDLLALV